MAVQDEGMDLTIGLKVDVSAFQKEWESNYLKQIQKQLDANPVTLKVKATGLDEVTAELKKLQATTSLIKPSSLAAITGSKIRAEAAASATALKAQTAASNATILANEKLAQQQAKTAMMQQKATNAAKTYNSELSKTRGLLNGMPQFLNAYISVLGATRLVNNIRNITAEFELQRTALAAILQDAPAANRLFEQTLSQAIESPFTAKELITYTKQLSAYRIETDKLFQTTKMLADVSAGLGVSLDRLILAYGQVRAASVLRGTEVRQFTEAGIPLIEELADKYTELEGRAVSTAEVFDRISRRKVPFEDVAAIFEDMTSSSGIFYDMQKKQSETLYGLYQKINDQLQITFSRIGEDNVGALRAGGEAALYFAQNLDKIITAVANLGVAWGTYTIAQKAYVAMTGAAASSMVKNIKSEKLRIASALQLKGALQELTAEERMRIATARQLTAEDVRSLAANKAYTSAVGARLVATKTISKEVALMTAAELQLSKAEITQLANMKKLTVAWKLMSAGIRTVIASLKALTVAALSNPFTWLMAAIPIISNFISKQKELKESMAATSREYDEQKAKVSLIADEYERLTKKVEGAQAAQEEFAKTDIYKDKFAQLNKLASAYESLIGQKNIIDLSDVTPENIDTEFNKLKERYEEAIRYTQLLGYETDRMGEKLTKRVADAGTAYTEFDKALGDANVNFTIIAQKIQENYDQMTNYERGLIDAFMQSQREGQSDLDYLNQRLTILKKLRYVASSDDIGQLTSVWEVGSKNKAMFGDMDNYVDELIKRWEKLAKASQRAEEVVAETIKAMKIDAENLTPERQEGLEIAIRTKFSDKDWNDYARELTQKAARMQLGINVVFNPVDLTDTLSGWRKEFAALLGDEIEQDTSYQKAKQKLIEAYNDEKEVYNDLVNQQKAGQTINKDELQDSADKIAALRKLAASYGIVLESQRQVTENSPSQQLMNEIDVLKQAYQQYQKLTEVMGNTQAYDKVNEAFAVLFKDFKYLKGAVTPTNVKDMISYLQKALDSGVLDEKTEIKVKAEISEDTVSELVNSMQKALEDAREQIERSKAANTFYEGLLASGFGEPVAWQMTMDLYGANPMDIRAQMEANLREAFKEKLELDLPLSLAEAESTVKQNASKIGQETANMLLSLISDLRNYDAETIQSLQDNLSKTSELEAKRIKIYRDSAAAIAKLRATTIPEDQKRIMEENIKQNQSEQLASLGWEEFKAGDLYTSLFSDLDKVSTAALQRLRDRLEELKGQLSDLPADQLKEIMSAMTKLDKELVERDPFSAVVDNIGALFGGYKRLRQAEEEYISAQNIADDYQRKYNDLLGERLNLESQIQSLRMSGGDTTELEKELAKKEQEIEILRIQLEAAQKNAKGKKSVADDQQKAIDDLMTGLSEADKALGEIRDGFSTIRDLIETIGVDLEDTTIGAMFDGIDDGIKSMQSVVSIMQSIIALKQILNASNPLGWVTIGVGAIVGTLSAIFNAKSNRLQREIEGLEGTVHNLQRAYGNLKDAAENALGNNLIRVTQEQQRNLQAQAEAYRKMYEAESQKGKKRDTEKMQEYWESYGDTLKEVGEVQEELVNTIAGTDITSAARDFAQAWLDAYTSFSSTTDALQDKFDDMIQNMIVEAGLAAIAQALLQPLYDAIDQATEDGDLTKQELSDIFKLIPAISSNMNLAFEDWVKGLEQLGLDLQKGESNLTGISAAASNITEDAALTLGAIGNNLVYYVVSIHDLLAARFAMEGVSTDTSAPTLLSVQQAALTQLQAIQNNTARSALAAEQMVSTLSSVISPLGVKSGAKAINVNI